MQRVVKRFLLHNSREDDEAKESDFDEFKQDVQIARIEMLSDLKRSREAMLKYVMIIHTGISMLGDMVFTRTDGDDSNDHPIDEHQQPLALVLSEFGLFKHYDQTLKDELQMSLQTTALALRNQGYFYKTGATASTPLAPPTPALERASTSTSVEKSHDVAPTVQTAFVVADVVDTQDVIVSEKDTGVGQQTVVAFNELSIIKEEASQEIN